jgi:hypothetical protein
MAGWGTALMVRIILALQSATDSGNKKLPKLIDELRRGVVKINGPFLYVVMPMRLS